MKPIDPQGFEEMFRRNIDPWDYRTSPFEAHKRAVLLRACGFGPYGRAIELACANGETTLRLAPRTLRLLAVDSSETALAAAQKRLVDSPGVTIRRAVLPRDLPPGPFDLIVISELAYYLPRRDLDALGAAVVRALAPGGRVVLLHHLMPFADAAVPPRLAQAALRRTFARRMRLVFAERTGRYEAVAYRAPKA